MLDAPCLDEGREDVVEHEVDKRAGVAFRRRRLNRGVVVGLAVVDEVFDRRGVEEVVPRAEITARSLSV